MQWVIDAGSVGDRLVVIGANNEVGVVASAPVSGGPWEVQELQVPGVQQGFVNGGDVGPAGVAVALQEFDEGSGDIGRSVILHSPDLETWTESSLVDVLGPRRGGVSAVVVTDDRVDVSVVLSDANPQVTRLWATTASG